MRCPTVRVYDVGQAFEMLSSDVVSFDLDHLLELAGQSDATLIQVLRTAKLIAGRIASLRRDLGDRIIYKLQSIGTCVVVYLNMRYYRIGNRALVQVGGVLIGGWLSGVLLRLCLSRRASAFERFAWPALSKISKMSCPRECWFARHRYEDDIFLASSRVCTTCIDALVPHVCRGSVPFSHTPDNEVVTGSVTSNKFLDIVVTLAGPEDVSWIW